MNKVKYLEKETENNIRQDSFVGKFLSSIKQKMYGQRNKKKNQCAMTASKSKATIFVILIIGFIAGPAVSL